MSGIMGAPALQGLACVGRLCCSQGACSSTQTVVRDRALHSPSRCAHSTPRGLVLGCQEGGCVAVRSMVVCPNRHVCTCAWDPMLVGCGNMAAQWGPGLSGSQRTQRS